MERKWLEWSGASEIFWSGSGAEALIFTSAPCFWSGAQLERSGVGVERSWSGVGAELEWSGVEAALEWSGAEAQLEWSGAEPQLEWSIA